MSEQLTADYLFDLLRLRYPEPAWALIPQMRRGTGWSSNRTADAIAMATWKSRGYEIHGFEIKVSRSDWMHELKSPHKAEEMYEWCDRWWLVAPQEVVRGGEIPATWGFLSPKGKMLHCVQEAPKLEPRPIDRLFVAALLRRVAYKDPAPTALREAEKRGADKAEADAVEKILGLEKKIANFEEKSGLNIGTWHEPAKIGAIVKLLLNEGFNGISYHLETFRERIDQLDEALKKAEVEFPEIMARR